MSDEHVCLFSGIGGFSLAADAGEACDKVEAAMRSRYPTMRWMQGKELEGDGVRFGPTVQKLKTPVRKQNDQAHPQPGAAVVERNQNNQ